MAPLSDTHVEKLTADSRRLSAEEINALQAQLPDWQVIEEGGENRLRRVFKFKDFSQALAFTAAVGKLAEQQDHHPALLTEWGKVTVSWWTHKIGGLHRNDFIMAAKTDQIYQKQSVIF
ncbi:MAG: 4a-hydroxytetrahydrobiopterin dehydratase [Omnitrophica WOR_2 bacterium]